MMVDLNSSNSIANGDYYYGHDHLYSPAVLFYEDGTGAEIVERYEYDAYGKPTILSPAYSVLSSSQYGNPYTFTGRRLDVFDYNSTTGDYNYEIMYYRARYYDTDTGRFIQRDPLGIMPDGNSKINPYKPVRQYTDGLNIYQYVKSNSITQRDQFGLKADCNCIPNWHKYRNKKNKCPHSQPKEKSAIAYPGGSHSWYEDHLGNVWDFDYGPAFSKYHDNRVCFRGKDAFAGSQCCYYKDGPKKGQLDDSTCEMGTYDWGYGAGYDWHKKYDMKPHDKYAHCPNCGYATGLTLVY